MPIKGFTANSGFCSAGRALAAGVWLLLASSSPLHASLIELNSGVFFAITGGEGTGRGISFLADESFSIDSIGIQADLIEKSYDVMVWSSTDGHQLNAVLDSATVTRGGSGFGFYDVPFTFSFNAGSYYGLLWRPNDGESWVGAGGMAYYDDSGLPTIAGPTTLIDGFEGFGGESFGNTLHPNLRINVVEDVNAVPEPSSLFLVLGGFGLLALRKLKRRGDRTVPVLT